MFNKETYWQTYFNDEIVANKQTRCAQVTRSPQLVSKSISMYMNNPMQAHPSSFSIMVVAVILALFTSLALALYERGYSVMLP